MQLHEAVRDARADLGLSQKKLAQLAGIQRRQLATLEGGGNVTLATLRKVLAQLPNLESFTLDAVTVNLRSEEVQQLQVRVTQAMELMIATLQQLSVSMATHGGPTESDLLALRDAKATLQDSLPAPEEVARMRAVVEEADRRLAELEAEDTATDDD